MHPQFQTPGDAVEPLAAWATALPALFALVLAVGGCWGLRRLMRPTLALWAVLGIAVAVRFLWMPVELHLFDGHEAEYRDIFTGDRALSRGSVMLYPAMQWLYAGLGQLSSNTSVLLAFSGLASLLSIAALYGITRRLTGARSAWVAAGILALWGNHAFWASSAYNVALPLALSLVAIWALLVLGQEEEELRPYAAACAAGCAALAVATRAESILLAPVGLAFFLLEKPRLRGMHWGILALGALLGSWALWAVFSAGPVPGSEERSLAFAINWSHLGFWEPLDGWAGLCLFPAMWMGWRRARGPILVGAVSLILLQLLLATFNDVGFRHSLLGLWIAAFLLAQLSSRTWGWGVLGVFSIGLLVHTKDVADRYYLSEEQLGEMLSEAPLFPESKLSECVLICEDPRVLPESQQLSHFNVLYPDPSSEKENLNNCYYWLYGVQDARWSSRAVRDRALRLEHLFGAEEVGRIERSNGYVGSVRRIEAVP